MKNRTVERDRLSRARDCMRAKGIKALLITRQENVRYLTGFTGSAGCVLIAKGKPVLITDFRYQLQARQETTAVAIRIQKRDMFTAVAEAANKLGAAAIWFDETSLTLDRVRQFRKKGLRLRGCEDPVADLRQRKDATEISRIRTAIRRAEESFLELKRYIKPGAAERELALRLEWLMREKGARKAAFDTIVASGANGAKPHASVSGRRLRNGDLVTIDFGAEADGYFCDITRTLCVGKPTARQKEIHALVVKAQASAIEAVRPAAFCKDIDKAARDVIEAAGQGKNFGHATGHGVGLMVHEAPTLATAAKAKIEPGMVVTVEPGVYIPGWGGVRIEDMVLVTERGAQVLTTLPRGL